MTTIRTRHLLAALAALFLSVTAAADEPVDGPLLTALLHSFLLGASQNDPAAHDRFWSERLVYTSSGGERFGKAEIMSGLENSEEENGPSMVYSAEDIRIQLYGDTAVVAFRLMATPAAGDGGIVPYFNTGTFVKEQGNWRAVAWQATKIPVD